MRRVKYSIIYCVTIAILVILFGFLISVQFFPKVFSDQITDQVIQTVDHATLEDLPPVMIP